MAAAAADERASRPLHQAGQLRGLGRDRERARLDVPRIQQVADLAAHMPGLLDDDAVELDTVTYSVPIRHAYRPVWV
ncbi:MAG: hypothetical protein OXP08_02875 [bacterium]|nr:hypothetical protein [bacterium]